MIQILSTKKLAKSLKKKLSAASISCVEKNFIKTSSLPFDKPELNDYLIFTSKKAVKSVLKSKNKYVFSKPCLCVGEKTKKKLLKNKFEVIEGTDYAADLIKIIDKKYKTNTFTFFCGNIRRNTIPDYLQQNEIKYNEITAYTTTLKPRLIKKNYEAVLFYSPSGVNSFLEHNSIEDKICFCIGTTTADALENKTDKIVLASQPTIENVITAVLNYYQR